MADDDLYWIYRDLEYWIPPDFKFGPPIPFRIVTFVDESPIGIPIVPMGRVLDGAKGTDGNDWIVGKSGEDTLVGGRGDDLLSGGAKDDSLTGGRGADAFLFGTKLKRAGVDSLDFEPGKDLLLLRRSVFPELEVGKLSAKQFDKHFDVDEQGLISYKDGKQAIVFAKIDNDLKITHHDFLIL
jgi:hypothetical protein